MSEKNRSRTRILALVALVAASLLFMLWLAGLLEFGKIPPGTVAWKISPPSGRIFTVQETEIPQELTVVAQVMSKTLAQVSAQVPGRVQEIRVEAGHHVKAGDPLIALHGPEYQARVGQAQAGVAQAQAHLTQVTADYERYRRLLKEGAVSPREFEAMEAKFKAAQGALSQARAQVQEAAAFKNYTVLKAPLSGVVAERLAAVGDLAQPGQPLVTLYDPGRLQIEGEVSEANREYLKIGMPVRFEVPAAELQGESLIAEIFPISAVPSRTFKIRTAFLSPGQPVTAASAPVSGPPRPEGAQGQPALVPGMFARLHLNIGKTRGLLIPQAAVHLVGQLTMVEALVDGRSVRRQVKLGRQIGEQVEVLAGLQPGDQILLP